MITPNESYKELGKAIGFDDLYFKREDLHPYGSHKGRSIPVMIDHYYKLGERQFAISSSGNAALAAALYIRELNTGNKQPALLEIYVGNHIDENKLEKLEKLADNHISIRKKERPLQALTAAVQEGKRSLRQSTDNIALLGYESLAEELSRVKNIGAVFVGTSSGTTAQSLAEYFSKNKLPIQVHIVQTSSCHPMSDAFDSFETGNEISIADAIVDQSALRKSKLITLIKKSGGRGWSASNSDITTAQELTATHTGLNISTNSALSVVGAMQAAYMGYGIKGAVVCLLGGE